MLWEGRINNVGVSQSSCRLDSSPEGNSHARSVAILGVGACLVAVTFAGTTLLLRLASL
jgi:hypothetical protein